MLHCHLSSDIYKILIIGGGLVGVEMAAEIICSFPGKEVVLVHSQSTLISRFPKKAIRYVENFLKERGVTIICNERVIGHKNQVLFLSFLSSYLVLIIVLKIFATDVGTEITAEVAFLCTGIQPNSGFLRENFQDCISPAGYPYGR